MSNFRKKTSTIESRTRRLLGEESEKFNVHPSFEEMEKIIKSETESLCFLEFQDIFDFLFIVRNWLDKNTEKFSTHALKNKLAINEVIDDLSCDLSGSLEERIEKRKKTIKKMEKVDSDYIFLDVHLLREYVDRVSFKFLGFK